MTPYVVTSYDPLTRAAQLLLIDRIRCPSLLGQKYWENYPTFSRGCSIIKKILHVHIAQSKNQPVKLCLFFFGVKKGRLPLQKTPKILLTVIYFVYFR